MKEEQADEKVVEDVEDDAKVRFVTVINVIQLRELSLFFTH
jgi:hypothetical protein